MTDLHKALVSMNQDPTNQEKQSDFYNLFLNTTFYLPSVTEILKSKESESKEVSLPMIIPAEGREYFVLFDTEDRLHVWAGKKVEFLSMPGHAITDFSPATFRWVLNPGSTQSHEFIAEEISWLKKVIAAHKSAKIGNKVGTTPCANSR